MYQVVLPEKYQQIAGDEAVALIGQSKRRLGRQVVILGHHYQRDEIIGFADFTGDSLRLSQIAAEQRGVDFIVFCGVHFMAESADILTSDRQRVFLPDMTAGCPMADMADIDQVEQCWEYLQEQLGGSSKLVPLTYVNSSAAIKAFCGRNEGVCVTSSNCRGVFEWVWGNAPQAVILFLPDQHLGRNTAYDMGVKLEEMSLWDPYQSGGVIERQRLEESRIVLWDGFCSVHQEFKVEQIAQVRGEDEQVKVIVHPECNFEVVRQADYVGSTAYIIKTIEAATEGSSWVVGTEINLVNRLAQELAGRNIKVRSLSGTACLCETMYRINPEHLAWLLEMLADYVESPDEVKLYNQVVVPDAIKDDARAALDKMLAITAAVGS